MDLIEKAARKLKQSSRQSLVERAAGKLGGVSSAEQKADVAENPVARAAPAVAPEPAAAAQTAVSPKKTSRRVELDLKSLKERGFLTPDTDPTMTAEEFRIVKRSLLLNAFAKGDAAIKNGNLILVTSAQPNEGKTYCSINLAMSVASEQDLTVLLVDADFSKPEVLNTLGVTGGKGLVDVISETGVDLSDCLIRTNIPNLSILPAGRQHNLTPELLASERMGEIVEEIATRYRDRVIIFDSPPSLASSAASVLALHVGQCLFVVEAEKTTDNDLKEALSLISGCEHVNLLLNKTRFSGSNSKFGSYYGYGYQ